MPSHATEKATSRQSNQPVAKALEQLLSDTYTLFLTTHNYHWNVEGPQFVSLHTLFEDQYNEQFKAIDEIAERIRALDAYALPQGYSTIGSQVEKLAGVTASASKDKNTNAMEMVRTLANLQEKAIQSAQKAKQLAEDAGDDESVDLMVERITAHQKSAWMLKSLLK